MKNLLQITSLKGGALLYVIFIFMIISSLLSSFLLINGHISRTNHIFFSQQHASLNLDSGLNLLMTNGTLLPPSGELELFDSGKDFFRWKAEPWGLFQLVDAEGQHNNAVQRRSCFLGQKVPEAYQRSLVLSDQRQALMLAGDTEINGRLSVPKAGIRTTYLPGKPFTGTTPIESQVNYSNSNDYSLELNSLQSIKHIMERFPEQESASEIYILEEMIVEQPWEDSASVHYFPHSIELNRASLKGKCMIISNGRIELSANSHLLHSILIAKEIAIAPGFQGTVQAFATERLEVGTGAKLRYPSHLLLYKGEQPGSIHIEEEALVEGAIVYTYGQDHKEVSLEDQLSLAESALLKGGIYGKHHLDLKGSVWGNVVANNFLARIGNKAYRNYLIDAELDFGSLSAEYVAPCIFPEKQYRLIEWL